MLLSPPQVPVRNTTSKEPSSELRRNKRSLAPDSVPALTISPSGSLTFAAAVI